MQINRLFEIVYLLMDKRTMTAKELAEHFEVSPRTILRDIDILIQANIPLYTSRGKGGGISLLDGYVLNKATLTEEERQQILLSLQGLPATGHINTDQATRKLNSLFGNPSQDWIEVDFTRWGQTGQDNNRFALLKQAILSQTAIGFDYINSMGERSTREIYPLKLIFKGQSWYLQGYCLSRQDHRTFKLNRILELTVTEKNFDRSKFPPPPLERSQPAPTENYILLELIFKPSAAHRAYDEFAENNITPLDDGTYHVLASIPENEWLHRFLRSLGTDITILQPPHLS